MNQQAKNEETIASHEDDALNNYLDGLDTNHEDMCTCPNCMDQRQNHCKDENCMKELKEGEIDYCLECLE